MMAPDGQAEAAPERRSAQPSERRALGVACGAHALNDGYGDLITLMLPVWQAEFDLAYAQVGVLRTLFSGTMAGLQIPAGLAAERFGIVRVLATGTALAACGVLAAGASGGLMTLAMALVLAGVGASVQHPLASALVARAFPGVRAVTALGTYNFAGDIGKMAVPAAVALAITLMPWRPALSFAGLAGLAVAAAIAAFAPRLSAAAAPAARRGEVRAAPARSGFLLLLGIGVVDSMTRMGFLTFLPFLLTMKGASVAAVGLALAAVFAGGACGKLACAFVGARIGTFATVLMTEALTAVAIVALLPLPLEACYVLLPILGVALNGTSSVLYGSVPLLVDGDKRARAFSVFYTGTIGAGASSPVLFGLVGDLVGVPVTLAIVAALVLVTLPLAVALRPALMR